ncbi:MAG TPA: hypothetical protein VGZ47_19980 [Gemmataceae bacterium]|jgi:hypothetical protein|nr:hypothetical protein [Gemmataceae bacterium]
MSEKRIGCPQCGAALVLDGESAAAEKARCPDCKAVFAVPRDPSPREAAPPRPARRPVRSGRSSRGSGTPVVLLAVGSVALVILVVAGAIAVIALLGKGGVSPLAGGGAFSASGLGINPLATKANLGRVHEGMTLEESQAILGPGAPAGKNDMAMAFGSEKVDPYDQTDPPEEIKIRNGRIWGVTDWYQWRSGNLNIFIGFAKGKRSGKYKAMLAFWVEKFDSRIGGTGSFRCDSETAFTGRYTDPDRITDEREAEDRKINDPKWKKGDPRQLLPGRWVIAGSVLKDGFEFGANGAVKSYGLQDHDYTSTYRFVDDNHIEINVPPTLTTKARVDKYRVLVSQNELLLVRERPGGHRREFDVTEYVRTR